MSRLNKVLNESNSQIENSIKKIPTYQENGKAHPQHKTRNTVIGVILLVFTVIILFLYVPQLWMGKKKTTSENKYVIQPDPTMIAVKNQSYATSGSEDYDGDSLDTVAEDKNHCDAWNIDSDGDGADDCYEIYVSKTDPSKYEIDVAINYQKELDKQNGNSLNTPYQIGNVILWADDYESKALGGVVENAKGYRFTHFNGYAQFPHTGKIYAYCTDSGKHELLSYREAEDAWKIDGKRNIVITTEPLEDIVEFHIFGKQIYAKKNGLSSFFNFILPSKGYITAEAKTRVDVEPDTTPKKTADNMLFNYDPKDGARFCKNTISLSNLQFVRSMIDDNRCVLVSLFDFNDGEVIGVVYGYTQDNDLLICDEKGNHLGVIDIIEKGRKMLSGSGKQYLYTYFDWEGLGFSSASLDNISFFAVADPKKEPVIEPITELTEEPTTEQTEEPTEETTEEPTTEKIQTKSGIDLSTAEWRQDEKGWWLVDKNGVYARDETIVVDGIAWSFDKRGYWIEPKEEEPQEEQSEEPKTEEPKTSE